MTQVNDLSGSLAAFDPISTLVVVVEMSKASWLVRSVVPGVERQPLKKLEADATALLRLVERWRSEAVRAGRPGAAPYLGRSSTGWIAVGQSQRLLSRVERHRQLGQIEGVQETTCRHSGA